MARKVKKAGDTSKPDEKEEKKIVLRPTVIKKVEDNKDADKKVVKKNKKSEEGEECVTSNDCAGKYSCLPVEDRRGA